MSRSCPSCKNDKPICLASMTAKQIIESSPYYSADSYNRLGVKPESKYKIVRCKECSLVYADDLPSEDFLRILYTPNEEENIQDAVAVFSRPGRLSQQLFSFSSLLKILEQKVSLNKYNVPIKPVRILDYGCSFGAGLLSLVRPGYPYELIGVEINDVARDYLQKQSVKMYSKLGEINVDNKFDGIVLNDVLEHVPDPLSLLKQLYNLAEDNAVIFINVPDFSEWRLKSIIQQITSGNNVEKDMNPWEHLTYFSPGTLNDVAAKAGWRRIKPIKYSYSFVKERKLVKKYLGLIRVLRDWRRFQRGELPAKYSTSGYFLKE